MIQAVEISNMEHSVADLRRHASQEKDDEVVRQLLTLAMVSDDHLRTEVFSPVATWPDRSLA